MDYSEEASSAHRTPGYYWVMPNSEWEPGLWTGQHWLITGEADHLSDGDMDLIGPHIPLPNQQEIFRSAKPSLVSNSFEQDIDACIDKAQRLMEIHHDLDPEDNDLGMFCRDDTSGAGGGIGAFYWFNSMDSMLEFIAQVLPYNPPGPSYDNPHLKQQQIGLIADAIRIKAISDHEGFRQINKSLSAYSNIEWWGTFRELAEGNCSFSKTLIHHFEQTLHLSRPSTTKDNKEIFTSFLKDYGI